MIEIQDGCLPLAQFPSDADLLFCRPKALSSASVCLCVERPDPEFGIRQYAGVPISAAVRSEAEMISKENYQPFSFIGL